MIIADPGQIVVVTPVYEDREASACVFRELHAVLGDRLLLVAIDDGSVREPLLPSALVDANVSGALIRLKRNVGHQRAIAIGLNWLVENVPDATRVVVMDSDGEDLPESIGQLIALLEQPGVDVVVAKRRNRAESVKFKLFYGVYRWLFRLLSGRQISFGNFMAMNREAIVRLVSMHEIWIHLAGSVLTSRLRVMLHPLDRGRRYAGNSKMNFVGLALHGFRALMVFAEDVLVRVGIACTLVAALSILFGVAAVVLKLIGVATPGWFSVALGILLLIFMQTGAVTLMTLMLTGVIRGGSVAKIDYQDFIDVVSPVLQSSSFAAGSRSA